ncbi:hypothetical protein DFH06DRAFT_1376042 [Mycena polygramma]|nr:hypothetical protein DFH06DRAFT_1376042 [Mycena polygramma]
MSQSFAPSSFNWTATHSRSVFHFFIVGELPRCDLGTNLTCGNISYPFNLLLRLGQQFIRPDLFRNLSHKLNKPTCTPVSRLTCRVQIVGFQSLMRWLDSNSSQDRPTIICVFTQLHCSAPRSNSLAPQHCVGVEPQSHNGLGHLGHLGETRPQYYEFNSRSLADQLKTFVTTLVAFNSDSSQRRPALKTGVASFLICRLYSSLKTFCPYTDLGNTDTGYVDYVATVAESAHRRVAGTARRAVMRTRRRVRGHTVHTQCRTASTHIVRSRASCAQRAGRALKADADAHSDSIRSMRGRLADLHDLRTSVDAGARHARRAHGVPARRAQNTRDLRGAWGAERGEGGKRGEGKERRGGEEGEEGRTEKRKRKKLPRTVHVAASPSRFGVGRAAARGEREVSKQSEAGMRYTHLKLSRAHPPCVCRGEAEHAPGCQSSRVGVCASRARFGAA